MADAQRKLNKLQWAIPALTGTLLVMDALMGEQQRPNQAAPGLRPAPAAGQPGRLTPPTVRRQLTAYDAANCSQIVALVARPVSPGAWPTWAPRLCARFFREARSSRKMPAAARTALTTISAHGMLLGRRALGHHQLVDLAADARGR